MSGGVTPWRTPIAIARARGRYSSTGPISRRPEIPTGHRCRNGRGSNRINADTWSSFPKGQSKRSISGAHSASYSRRRSRPAAGSTSVPGAPRLASFARRGIPPPPTPLDFDFEDPAKAKQQYCRLSPPHRPPQNLPSLSPPLKSRPPPPALRIKHQRLQLLHHPHRHHIPRIHRTRISHQSINILRRIRFLI